MDDLVDEMCARWQLTLARVLPADYSFVAEVTRADGTAAILKLVVPEPENMHEAEGLRRWGGNGAVRVYEAEPERGALLLERVVPGTKLWELPEDEGVAIAARLLPRLWLGVEPDHPFERADGLAQHWANWLDRSRVPLAADAAAAFRELGPTQGEQVLVHRDFHRGNLLSSQREPWLAIDPKTSVAEREFDAAWLVGDRPSDPRGRLDLLADALELDPERLRLWTVARYVLGAAWSYEEEDRDADGHDQIAVARALM